MNKLAKTLSTLAACLVVGLSLVGSVSAGAKTYNYNVYIGSTYAYGSLGHVRNSSDSTQRIGCQVHGNYLGCFARNKAGKSKSCSFKSADRSKYTAILATQTESSTLRFYYDSSGYCTNLWITNSSELAPKK